MTWFDFFLLMIVLLGMLLIYDGLRRFRSGWHPHYTSTACIHGMHGQCRLFCKWGPEPSSGKSEHCKCHCHNGGGS
jgi:hypothetical protein